MHTLTKTKAVLIVAVAIIVSGVLGVGSARMSGHEAIIFSILELAFLVWYGLVLTVLSLKIYRSNDKTTGHFLLLTSLTAIGAGYGVFTFIGQYL